MTRRSRSSRLGAGIVAGLLLFTFASSSVFAETPFVVDEWRLGRRDQSTQLAYCVDQRDPDWKIASAIGRAIAGALILEPKEHVVSDDLAVGSIDDLYRILRETCDLYMGFRLIADVHPEWLALTRAYYSASYVATVIEPGWTSLADMPFSRAIAAAVGSSADVRAANYLITLPVGQRWQRFPMTGDEAALRSVLSGTAGAALVWEPTVWALQNASPDFASVRIIDRKPLPAVTLEIGGALLAGDAFLRSNVDKAIESITNDGTLQTLFDAEKFPGRIVK